MTTIRKAVLADVPQLAKLFNEYRIFYDKTSDLTGAENFLKDRLQKKESVVFVSEHAGVLTGFVQLYPTFSSTRMKRIWVLNDLFVEHSHRGKGISKLLIEAAKNLCIATNGCSLVLETSKNNSIGNKLYSSEGFHIDKEYNHYNWDIE
jgi:GNAT superfamily N-acetyltransferase